MTRFRQPLRCLLWLGAIALPLAHQAVAQDNATGRTQPKVFVVPMKGPLYYRMSATELSKVIRAAMVQKPEAFILVISSPGGNREAAFQIAQQIADAELSNTVAYVSGEHRGAFGPAVLPLMACRRVFLAPNNAIELGATTRQADEPAAGPAPLSPRQISLLQSWAAASRRPWTPIQHWLTEGGLLAPAEPAAAPAPAPPRAASRPARAPASEARPASRAGLTALRAEQASSIEAILQKLDIFGARVVTWPDPVERTNQTMERVFRQTDEQVKAANNAIAAARQADPRAQRYELRGTTPEYPIAPIVIAPGMQIGTEYRASDALADRDVFADGGASWRAYTDRCLGFVRQAISANRRLSTLAALYPELGIDPKELNESYTTLTAWQSQLRAERPLTTPPTTAP